MDYAVTLIGILGCQFNLFISLSDYSVDCNVKLALYLYKLGKCFLKALEIHNYVYLLTNSMANTF